MGGDEQVAPGAVHLLHGSVAAEVGQALGVASVHSRIEEQLDDTVVLQPVVGLSDAAADSKEALVARLTAETTAAAVTEEVMAAAAAVAELRCVQHDVPHTFG